MTTAAEMPCSNCGATNAAEARFCSSCGMTLVTRVWVEERRTVTAVFADLVGSTSLGERTDPEVMRALVGRFFELASAEIRSRGETYWEYQSPLANFLLRQGRTDEGERGWRRLGRAQASTPRTGLRWRGSSVMRRRRARRGSAPAEATQTPKARIRPNSRRYTGGPRSRTHPGGPKSRGSAAA